MRTTSFMSAFFSLTLIISILLAIPTGKATPLSVTNIYIEPTGYEEPSTHEWKGSFWIVTAIVNTKESFLFYNFNQTKASSYGQNKIGDKTIVPTATIRITITPRQPYWEIPLKNNRYLVYPKTYGAYFNYWSPEYKLRGPDKIQDIFVPPLYVDVLECDINDVWTLHTPFDIMVEKVGQNAFTKTIEEINTVGGTNIISVENPADNSEKMIITDLGKLGTGYDQPPFNKIIIFNKTVAFEKTDDLLKAVDYWKAIDKETHTRLTQENFAFYWFGGGRFKSEGKYDVLFWPDDCSPAHCCKKPPLNYYSLVEDDDFPGSYRQDGPNPWDQRALPIAANIADLINYLQNVANFTTLNLNLFKENWTLTSENKLCIYLPTGAASSVITMKISSELADSVVYQPIVANGKVEQAFWDSTKTTKAIIKDKDVAVLKVKQYASQPSKIIVKPSVPANIPVSILPQTDSAIVDPNTVHSFFFEIRNLGTQTNQSTTITFTITNDLGTITDTVTLDFDLIVSENVHQNPAPDNTEVEGDPLWIWVIVVISITVITACTYTIYIYQSSKKSLSQKKE